MHIQIADRRGRLANTLELPQPRPCRLSQRVPSCAAFAHHSLKRCLQAARAGSRAMHRLRICILDTLRHGGVGGVGNRPQMSQPVFFRVGSGFGQMGVPLLTDTD